MQQQRHGPKNWIQPLLALVSCESIFWGVAAILRPSVLTSEVLLCLVTANLAGLLSWRCRKLARIPVNRGEKYLIATVFLVLAGRFLVNSAIGQALTLAATERNDVESLRLLLTFSASRNNVLPGESWTPLTAAVHLNNQGVANLLLEAGADPHRADTHGWTPLMIARYRGDEDMAALLTRYGAIDRPLPVLPKKKS